MRKTSAFMRSAGLILCALLMALNCTQAFCQLRELPEDIYVDSAEGLGELPFAGGALFSVEDDSGLPVTVENSQTLETDGLTDASYTIRFLGLPVKRVSVHLRGGVSLMPGGYTIGINLYTRGVLVVGLGNLSTEYGNLSPARQAGIEPGDLITAVDGEPVRTVTRLTELCSEPGRTHEIKLERNGEVISLNVTPLYDSSGSGASLGLWARDSSAGIGTLSFYEMADMRCAALGHAVTDPDTGIIIPADDGKLVRASIVGITHGRQGSPGELQASFSALSERLAKATHNSEMGIFGKMERQLVNPLYPEGLPLAYPEEIEEGPACILSMINGEMRAYSCEIIKVYRQPLSESKGMVIRITDGDLIELTGGIVQGMSGSPIIQNGKIAGAVTHVFINDPLKGYGIYALWMYERAKSGEY